MSNHTVNKKIANNKAGKDSISIKDSPSKKEKHSKEKLRMNYALIPILVVLVIIPFIVMLKVYDPMMSQYPWFPNQNYYNDFFLYYKQRLLIITGTVMLLMCVYKTLKSKKDVKEVQIFIPLAVYAVLALLSAVFSKYSYFSFVGSLDQFESVFALLSYCVITYYAFLYVKTEYDVQLICRVIICAATLLAFLGILQYAGHDFLTSEIGLKLTVPLEYQTNGVSVNANFGLRRVYMTLFNPNYVGVYVALIAPILIVLIFVEKEMVWRVISIIGVIGLLICEYGSQSLAGFIGLGVAVLMMLIFFRREIFKRPAVPLSIIAILVLGVIVINSSQDNFMINKFKSIFSEEAPAYLLTDIQTLDDGILIEYNENKAKIVNTINPDQTMVLQVIDESGNSIPTNFDTESHTYTVENDKYAGLVLAFDIESPGIFYVRADGRAYGFTNLTGDGTYYYLNEYGKLDKLLTAPAAVFTGNQAIASNRGYIWSRTIPLLKRYFVIGSGPDTFTLVFPQNDYFNKRLVGYQGQIMTKPHNLYLQIAVQTGVLSLIAFLAFFGMYFIQSIHLYFKGHFNNTYSQVGIAVFIGTVSYMVTGLANDSTITVAPIFWALIGIGISVNCKVKQMMQREKSGK